MTNDDRMSALDLAMESQSRVRSDVNPDGLNIGGLAFNKKDGDPFGSDAAQLLISNNGSFIWDMRDDINGLSSFDNIHQYAAAEIYAPNGSLRARIEASQQYENAARAGINSLAKWLVDVWGVPLFRLKEPGSGNKITVITVRPDYEDPHTGKTAADLLREKDRKQIEGQVGAARKRLARQFDESDVANILRGAVETALTKQLAPPRVKRLE